MLPRKKDIAKRDRQAAEPEHCPKHLSFIRRTYVCAAWKSGECEGPNHAHHVTAGGMGMKCSDFDAVPLCARHHQILHDSGKQTFEAKYAVDLLAEARKLVSPYRAKVSP